MSLVLSDITLADDPTSFVDNDPNDQPTVPPYTKPNIQIETAGASFTKFKFRGLQDTPSARTGPPRSLSYHFSNPRTPGPSRSNTYPEEVELLEPEHGTGSPFALISVDSEFRGALELGSLGRDRKGKRREKRHLEDIWNTRPPLDLELGKAKKPDRSSPKNGIDANDDHREESPRRKGTPPHSPTKVGWNRLRSLLPNVVSQASFTPADPSCVTSYSVNITDELITGGLSTLMLRLWFERDEKNHRRLPLLFHRLRLRVSDSLHPLHANSSVFRIECEYANGTVRWVIYRQLRDFLSLHAHYAFSNAFNHNADKLPQFPRTSLPYFKFLKKELREKGKEMGRVEFARMQREALENYLINLIRAVMFHPSANRLAGFLEVSALSISLARSGGFQSKAGFLRIKASGNKGAGFGRKSTSWSERQASRWCAVRESYLVVLEELGELVIWEVFLFDADFKIERPKRYYRRPLNIFHSESHKESYTESIDDGGKLKRHATDDHVDRSSVMGTIRHRLSRVFPHWHRHSEQQIGGQDAASPSSPNDHDPAISPSRVSLSSASSRAPTPMLDPSTNTNPLSSADERPDQMAEKLVDTNANDQKTQKSTVDVSKHTFYIENSQMRLKLFARNQRQMQQWITALEKVAGHSTWGRRNRFDSFSPVRLNVAAQWLVDGRDYFWNLSRAILLARDTIYIHDWWLSPELQLRRPDKPKYRLDNLLERKAKEGVKIYIILYQEVSNRTTPVDSNYAKQRLTSLHPNIMLQRSPSHFQTGTFYWAHHEKLCIVDQTIAFMGGIDLCFGRWDTPQHVLVDDPDPGIEQSTIWPGKDYSNPRILDFHTLHKPHEDLYDRSKVPRMPWHDVGIQVVGQPARDLARHFVQRWNFLLRIKNHTRVMPFLLPPPEFRPGELELLGLTGTCEMQICRSAGPWSMGTPNKTEHSIQNAYIKSIQMSEHFVYIENQFFITSTIVNDIKVENQIGDALVNRIIQAHRQGSRWRCCLVIPTLPGFSFPVDHSDASALRLILELQNRSISRGPNSIFGRLRKEGINPDDYISIFALRKWAKLRGDVLTTEQIYIHGKTCIVDDRLVIIGSANINERSLRGDRDSEIAAVIRDTDMIDCTMAGKPFKVGRFAHTLRVRLMQEHLGVDVDALSDEGPMSAEPATPEYDPKASDSSVDRAMDREGANSTPRVPSNKLVRHAIEGEHLNAQNLDGTVGNKSNVPDISFPHHHSKRGYAFSSLVLPALETKHIEENRPPKAEVNDDPTIDKVQREASLDTPNHAPSLATLQTGNSPEAVMPNCELHRSPVPSLRSLAANDRSPDVEPKSATRSLPQKHPVGHLGDKSWTLSTPTPHVDPQGFEDPISDEFWINVWVASADHNTKIFRKVFHAVPDDEIKTWRQYREFVAHHERLSMPMHDASANSSVTPIHETGVGDPSGPPPQPPLPEHVRGHKGFEKGERENMERLLEELCGHLVLYPLQFLEGEDNANNFLFNADRLLPLVIYN